MSFCSPFLGMSIVADRESAGWMMWLENEGWGGKQGEMVMKTGLVMDG